MSAREDGGAAFPFQFESLAGAKGWHESSGMTLRDYFAGRALTGLVGNQEQIDAFVGRTEGAAGVPKLVARLSYMYADAMLAERSK